MICIWSSWCRCHPIISCSSKKSRMVYLSGAGLPRLSWKKAGCSSVVVLWFIWSGYRRMMINVYGARCHLYRLVLCNWSLVWCSLQRLSLAFRWDEEAMRICVLHYLIQHALWISDILKVLFCNFGIYVLWRNSLNALFVVHFFEAVCWFTAK